MLRDACVVVVARQGRVDRYTRTATGIGILEYRQSVYALVVRNPGGRDAVEGAGGGGRLAFPCGFVVDRRTAIFDVALHLALSRAIRAAFKREKARQS